MSSSSWSGRKRVDGQRLGPLLAALSGPTTPVLHAASKHPLAPVRALLDRTFALVGGPRGHGVDETDLEVSGGGGARIPARLYTPVGIGASAPLLVFTHGGGFVVGSIDSHGRGCRLTAREARCKVLSVGYRKAPENPFPGPLDDAVAAFRWAVMNAHALGVDRQRIAVGGDSAGGNLAAGVCVATAGDDVRPAAAWLVYPFVDADIRSFASGRTFAEGPLLSTACAETMLGQYAPDPSAYADPRLSVLRTQDLDGFPPTYVATAGMDPLRDQGEAFAAKLRDAGVDVEVQRFGDLPHGFALLLVDRHARGATVTAARALRTLLEPRVVTAREEATTA
ncbi:alpha/beta hydrolase [Conexibacter sp. SYSU D00693]|uniref:alpha/beta hydrolase n=1 Tax=Conexibacter sp. SYSU D00693 TaxID=2812560 RepID=UPI00196A6FA0|nr:alpha/beta hydrolase [Conexibacter sp. SYSU D00693]